MPYSIVVQRVPKKKAVMETSKKSIMVNTVCFFIFQLCNKGNGFTSLSIDREERNYSTDG